MLCLIRKFDNQQNYIVNAACSRHFPFETIKYFPRLAFTYLNRAIQQPQKYPPASKMQKIIMSALMVRDRFDDSAKNVQNALGWN